MYKVLMADDEGIVLQSLKMIIEKNFGQSCEIATAKTGRGVIELAESFRPDIALVDIQMPGINGIDAIEEIKNFSLSTYFVIMTAYDKFDYAKKAIDLGVVDFITKPFGPDKIISVLERTMKMVDNDRHRREVNLKNKEKLETVVPIIESGLIYTILFQEDYSEQCESFRQLLEIEEEYGYMMIIEFGEQIQDRDLTNPVGVSVKAQRFYQELREIIKEFFKCYVGSLMANKVVAYVPCAKPEIEYNERICNIERARSMVDKLKKRIDVEFKVGIGSVIHMDQLLVSYKEAVKSMKMVDGPVTHIKDILPMQQQEASFDIEKQLLMELKKGDLASFSTEVINLYDFLLEAYHLDETVFRLKLFEIIVIVQREVKEYLQATLKTNDRLDDIILKCSISELKHNFTQQMNWLFECREGTQDKVYSDIIMSAKKIIDHSYHKDISLDMISREVNISPYYFSKIFKEETGENFIDYVTHIRIEKAKEVLRKGEVSIKEVCSSVGYKDPNYFSRLFKKQVGVTPTEYREGL